MIPYRFIALFAKKNYIFNIITTNIYHLVLYIAAQHIYEPVFTGTAVRKFCACWASVNKETPIPWFPWRPVTDDRGCRGATMTREAAPHKLMQKCIIPFSCQKDVSTFHLSARPRTKASRGNSVRTRNEKATFLPPHSLHLSGSCRCSLQSALITSFPSPTL